MMASTSKKIIGVVLCISLIVFNVPPLGYVHASEHVGIDPITQTPVYEIPFDENAPEESYLDSAAWIPSGSVIPYQHETVLTPATDEDKLPVQTFSVMEGQVSPAPISVLTGKPKVTSEGYNTLGHDDFPGYVGIIPNNNSNFSYRYDLAAAPGATVDVVIDRRSWTPPPIFRHIRRLGKVPQQEMFRVFNMGIGMVLVVSPYFLDSILGQLAKLKTPAFHIGEVVPGKGRVRFR